MERQTFTPHSMGYVLGVDYTSTATPSVTVNIGQEDYSAVRNSAGNVTLTPRTPNSFLDTATGSSYDQCCVGSTVGAGQGTTRFVTTSKSAINMISGARADVQMNAIVMGYRDREVKSNLRTLCQVDTSRLGQNIIGGAVATGGTQVNTSKNYTVTNTSTGVYTIVFTPGFGQTPYVVVTPAQATRRVRVASKTAGGCVINTTDLSDVLANGAFHFMVLGTQNKDPHGRRFANLFSKQRNQSLLPFTVKSNLTVGMGAGQATLTSGGTGIYNITFDGLAGRQPAFKSGITPIVVGNPLTAAVNDGDNLFISSVSNSAIQVTTTNAAGTATAYNFSCLILGSYSETF